MPVPESEIRKMRGRGMGMPVPYGEGGLNLPYPQFFFRPSYSMLLSRAPATLLLRVNQGLSHQ